MYPQTMPAADSRCPRVFTSAQSGMQLPQLPFEWGKSPVKSALRAGPQTGWQVYTLSKRMPRSAIESMFGVSIGEPYALTMLYPVESVMIQRNCLFAMGRSPFGLSAALTLS